MQKEIEEYERIKKSMMNNRRHFVTEADLIHPHPNPQPLHHHQHSHTVNLI